MNKSVTGAPYSINSYSMPHSRYDMLLWSDAIAADALSDLDLSVVLTRSILEIESSLVYHKMLFGWSHVFLDGSSLVPLH